MKQYEVVSWDTMECVVQIKCGGKIHRIEYPAEMTIKKVIEMLEKKAEEILGV